MATDFKKVTLTNLHNGNKFSAVVQTDDPDRAVVGSGKSAHERADVSNIGGIGAKLAFLKNRGSLDDSVVFFSGLAKCMGRNLGIMKGLKLQANRVKTPRYRGMIGDVTDEISMGEKLSSSMAKHDDLFSPDIIALLEAGEEAGQLAEVCDRIAVNKKKSSKIVKKLKGGMIYPIIVISIALIVVLLMSYTLIPAMAQLYKDFNAPLPLPTKILMKFSDLLRSHWWAGIVPFVILFIIFKNWGKIIQTKRAQSFFIKMPAIGNIVRKNSLAVSFRVFAMLIGANVRMTNALKITSKGAPHWHAKTFFSNVQMHVSEGMGLPESFLHESHWLGEDGRTVCGLMEVAAETGSGTELLNEIAEDFEEDLENLANNIDKLIEPITMIVLGTIIGGLVFSIYAPMFSMGQAVLGGS